MRKTFILLFASGLLLILWLIVTGGDSDNAVLEDLPLPETVDYNFHIKPILSDRCYTCHGPDAEAREADFRLDTEEGAFAKLTESTRSRAIVAGNASKSELYHRLIAEDSDERMPPASSKLSISPYEIALLKKWIDQGAEWKEHWSFVSPEKAPLPRISQPSWTRNPIDYFILQQIEDRGLTPSDPTDKASLLRRVSFDLTGLPPTLEELDAFLEDNSDTAYEAALDRLLMSPHYGERMAADWMDVARYADTHGYLDDTHREVWQWRDWVINAFNDNMPYDQFLIWQIAGDLIPKAAKEQQLATGFHRLHRQNGEGGVVPEEYRVEYVADRVQTTAKAFMGITMECARCHDHKYDPISQKEFYQLSAFFNSTHESGRPPFGYESGPTMLLTDDEVDHQILSIQRAIEEQKIVVQQTEAKSEKAYEEWIRSDKPSIKADSWMKQGLLAHIPFDSRQKNILPNLATPSTPASLIRWKPEHQLVIGKYGKALQLDEHLSVRLGTEIATFDRNDPFSVGLWVQLPHTYDNASVFTNCDHKWHGYRGYECRIKDGKLVFQLAHVFPHNAIQIVSEESVPVGEWVHLTLTYDGSSTAEGLTMYLNGNVLPSRITHNSLFKSIVHDPDNPMVFMPYVGFRLGARLNDPSIPEAKLDDLKIYNRLLHPVEVAELSGKKALQSLFDSTSLTEEQSNSLYPLFLTHIFQANHPAYQKLYELREAENQLLTDIPETMILGDQAPLRPTFVLNRGRYDDPGEEVSHAVPSILGGYPAHLPNNRFGLSRWLSHPRHPLTARIAVNRLWQLCFGEGLVRTPDDFGSQGELPTHPALLDWLAVELLESGWDLKALLKLIMMSATYQQSSGITALHQELDPDNKLFARAPRYRLPAEMLRDQALATAGLMVRTPGGKSIKPYQPDRLWEDQAFQAFTVYVQDTGEDLYKRSLYIYWKRNTPHPYMTTFDISDRAVCSVQRTITSSPLQALMLLNYPQFPEAARALAERVLQQGGKTTEDRLRYLFRTLSSHSPQQTELALMQELFQTEYQRFTKHPAEAEAYLDVGQYSVDPDLRSAELASYAVVAHSLLNTTKSYMKQ
ncbi:MAG: DUF1553 domain-containing protein [Bacteroidota bacterium]